jgi:hypothetical protein
MGFYVLCLLSFGFCKDLLFMYETPKIKACPHFLLYVFRKKEKLNCKSAHKHVALHSHTKWIEKKKHTHDDVRAFIDNGTMSVTVGAWGKKKMQALKWGLQHHLFLVVVIARASRGLWWRCSKSINKRLVAQWLHLLNDIHKDDKYSTYLIGHGG